MLAASGLARGDVFSPLKWVRTLKGAEAKQQFSLLLEGTGPWLEGAVDLLLIHWPSCDPKAGGSACSGPGSASSTPVCVVGGPVYDERACRLDTWKGLVEIWQAKGARAIGVSNYNASNLEEIKAPLPAVNQIPFNPYRSAYAASTI